MKERELRKIQRDLIENAVKNDQPADFSDWFSFDGLGYRETVTLWHLSANKTVLLSNDGFVPLGLIDVLILRLQNFYNAVDPWDFHILNQEVYRCGHCKINRTPDDFYPITKYPTNTPNIARIYTDGSIQLNYYCIDCVKTVPIKVYKKPNPGYVYLAKYDGMYKIGMSTDPEKRIYQLNSQYNGIKLLHKFFCKDRKSTEHHLHVIHLHRFEYNEIYSLTEEEVARIMAEGDEQ